MSQVQIAQKEPYAVTIEAGKKYAWCACGRSTKQPYCDGSHKGTNILPVLFEAESSETVYLCGCKHTKGHPYCDGSHNQLP